MQRISRDGAARRQTGFTLLELLLVVVILGIVTAVLIPQIGAGISGASLATGARTALQAARYARTMALLNQSETEVSFGYKSGIIRVMAVGEAAQRAAEVREERDSKRTAQPHHDFDPIDEVASLDNQSNTNLAAAEVTARSFADEINTEYHCYSDSFEAPGVTDSPAESDTRIRFRSNGTCRPFKLRLVFGDDDDGDAMVIEFDMMGSGKVLADAA